VVPENKEGRVHLDAVVQDKRQQVLFTQMCCKAWHKLRDAA